MCRHISDTSDHAVTGRLAWVFIVFALLTLTACGLYPTHSRSHLAVAEIVQMSRAGVADATIIDQIRSSGTVYALTASQLADLRQQGVHDPVINYMEQAHLQSVRKHQRLSDQRYWNTGNDGYRYGGYPFGWEDGWYRDTPFDVPEEE